MSISLQCQPAINLFRLVTRRPKTPGLLYGLLALDLVLIGFHLIHSGTDYLPSQQFALDQDRGYSEICQWIQIWATTILLWGLSLRRQSRLYGSWAMVFLLFLVNDIVRLHEQGGWLLAQFLSLPAGLGLEPADMGKLLIYGLVALLVIALVWVGYQKNRDAIARPTTLCLLVSLIGSLIASEIFDTVQVGLPWLTHQNVPPRLATAALLCEEGGELLISSLTLWFVWRLWQTFATLPRGVAPRPW